MRLKDELADKEEIMIAQSRHAAMGEMISMIAHQWRQPLSVIAMGANNMLVDIELDTVDVDKLKTQTLEIVDQTQYLSKTIDDFRNFFRPDKKSEKIFIREVMNESLDIIGKSLESSDIEVKKEYDSHTKIVTHSRELLQVFINIIKNAKEAFVGKEIKDKEISIKIYEDEENIYTTVCDNAGGMLDDILPKIFDPYFSTKDEKIGTGLGLYMSKTIIEKHLKGAMSVENSDKGACFKIALPVEKEKDNND